MIAGRLPNWQSALEDAMAQTGLRDGDDDAELAEVVIRQIDAGLSGGAGETTYLRHALDDLAGAGEDLADTLGYWDAGYQAVWLTTPADRGGGCEDEDTAALALSDEVAELILHGDAAEALRIAEAADSEDDSDD